MDAGIESSGEVRHCQGMVLADWVALAGDGRERGNGTNVCTLRGGRVASATGFSAPPKAALEAAAATSE